jgi:hypothetical protein
VRIQISVTVHLIDRDEAHREVAEVRAATMHVECIGNRLADLRDPRRSWRYPYLLQPGAAGLATPPYFAADQDEGRARTICRDL